MKSLFLWLVLAFMANQGLAAAPFDEDEAVRYLICHPDTPCIRVSPATLRAIMKDPETNTDDMEEVIDIPERRSSYLFRSRRSSFYPDSDKRTSSYLLRTRKSLVDPRTTRAESYLFRTRKDNNNMARNERGGYLFRTRKYDNDFMDRMLRSQGRSYLFRTR